MADIASKDKRLMTFESLISSKKKQMRDEYYDLKKKVKENPYLQEALDLYQAYFKKEEEQIKALKTLLKHIDSPADQKDIKREIAALEKSL